MSNEAKFWVVFILFWIGVLVIYAGSCWLWPYKKHARCDGSGKLRRDDGKVFKLCTDQWGGLVRGCGGSGRTLRWGRKAYNYLYRNQINAR